jgi:hypothetical protein
VRLPGARGGEVARHLPRHRHTVVVQETRGAKGRWPHTLECAAIHILRLSPAGVGQNLSSASSADPRGQDGIPEDRRARSPRSASSAVPRGRDGSRPGKRGWLRTDGRSPAVRARSRGRSPPQP